jgi:prefoldin subunit 5
MDREILLESLLNSTIERMGAQTKTYEGEIANLSAEIMVLKQEIVKFQDEVATLHTMNVSVSDIKKTRSAFTKNKDDQNQEVEDE